MDPRALEGPRREKPCDEEGQRKERQRVPVYGAPVENVPVVLGEGVVEKEDYDHEDDDEIEIFYLRPDYTPEGEHRGEGEEVEDKGVVRRKEKFLEEDPYDLEVGAADPFDPSGYVGLSAQAVTVPVPEAVGGLEEEPGTEVEEGGGGKVRHGPQASALEDAMPEEREPCGGEIDKPLVLREGPYGKEEPRDGGLPCAASLHVAPQEYGARQHVEGEREVRVGVNGVIGKERGGGEEEGGQERGQEARLPPDGEEDEPDHAYEVYGCPCLCHGLVEGAQRERDPHLKEGVQDEIG